MRVDIGSGMEIAHEAEPLREFDNMPFLFLKVYLLIDLKGRSTEEEKEQHLFTGSFPE